MYNHRVSFSGIKKMENDVFTKQVKNEFKVKNVVNVDDFEGYTSFYIPDESNIIQARHLINNSKNPPKYSDGDMVKGTFSLCLDNIKKLVSPTPSKISQNPQYGTDTSSVVEGVITKIDKDGNCVILSSNIPIETTIESDIESYKLGDMVSANGDLEFYYDN